MNVFTEIIESKNTVYFDTIREMLLSARINDYVNLNGTRRDQPTEFVFGKYTLKLTDGDVLGVRYVYNGKRKDDLDISIYFDKRTKQPTARICLNPPMDSAYKVIYDLKNEGVLATILGDVKGKFKGDIDPKELEEIHKYLVKWQRIEDND